MSKLILVRHTESQWNAKNLWTGLMDISLSEKGINQAKELINKLKGFQIDVAFTSKLKRSIETLNLIKEGLGLQNLQTTENKALNERNYGDYTGKNKFDIEKQLGHEKFLQIRRSWDYPIPNGETLKDVFNRAVPYYENSILPYLKNGKNVLIVAHGNSLRALVKYLDKISDEEVTNLEFEIGQIYIYEIDNNGNIASKKII